MPCFFRTGRTEPPKWRHGHGGRCLRGSAEARGSSRRNLLFSNVSCVSNEAAFQEAQELKDLIREADAERETLHDQLKQMKHGCLGRKESVTRGR